MANFRLPERTNAKLERLALDFDPPNKTLALIKVVDEAQEPTPQDASPSIEALRDTGL
jgi:hypothetical protein